MDRSDLEIRRSLLAKRLKSGFARGRAHPKGAVVMRAKMKNAHPQDDKFFLLAHTARTGLSPIDCRITSAHR